MSNSKWAPEDRKPTVAKQAASKTTSLVVTAPSPRITKDEALQSAKLFFDRFSGISIPLPMPNESDQQYQSRCALRLAPIVGAMASVKEVIRKAYI